MEAKSIMYFTILVTLTQGLPQNTPAVSLTTSTIASNDPVVNTPATTKVWIDETFYEYILWLIDFVNKYW